MLPPPTVVGAQPLLEGWGEPAVLRLAGGRGNRAQAFGTFSTKARPLWLSSWGLVESGSRVRKANPRLAGWRVGEGRAGLQLPPSPGCLPSQGDQDDRSYKQCRTSSPSSTGSVSLGRYTPTSRSPQHYSQPGTWLHGFLSPSQAVFLLLFLF